MADPKINNPTTSVPAESITAASDPTAAAKVDDITDKDLTPNDLRQRQVEMQKEAMKCLDSFGLAEGCLLENFSQGIINVARWFLPVSPSSTQSTNTAEDLSMPCPDEGASATQDADSSKWITIEEFTQRLDSSKEQMSPERRDLVIQLYTSYYEQYVTSQKCGSSQ